MIQSVKNRLKKISSVHSLYMRLKGLRNSELLGMTSKTEQNYFEKYGEQIYSGKGEIVDLGCWLGSTTIPLLRGLLKNPAFEKSSRKVYAYDLFVWYDWMNSSLIGTNLVGKYKEGDRFLDEFKKRTEKYASHIEICAGDLAEIGWNGNKIEFLLIDAMKNWELSNAIVKHFFGSLAADESYILHQDFGHYFTPWIHLLHWNFRDYFVFVEDVPDSGSTVFKCVKKIPAELVSKTYSFESFSDEEANAAFSYSMEIAPAGKQANIAAAKVMFYVHQNRLAEAQAALENLLKQGIPFEKDLIVVNDLLQNA
jgi:hypothetical protein